MSKYISGAKDKVNIIVDYSRPLFDFPDISGEYGNPREYFRLAVSRLRAEGFYREATELNFHSQDKYATHFNTICRFLDFTHNKIESEDDEYIYIKIKKGVDSIEQPRIFSLNSKKDILNLINEEHDFSMTNCYGRNHLHYIEDVNVIKLLVEENKQKQWFDIFHLDNFNSTLLHGNRNLFSFAYILNEMYEDSPELAERFLYGTNVFGENAFGEVLKQCNDMFSPIGPKITSDFIDSLVEVLKVIGKIDPDKRDEFILKIEENEINNPKLKGAGYKQMILKAIMEAELPINDEVKNTKRNKL